MSYKIIRFRIKINCMRTTLILVIILAFNFSLIGQITIQELNDNYCIKRLQIYDCQNDKRLNNKDGLELLKPFPKPYSYYERSVKNGKNAWISGISSLGFLVYIASNENMKNNGFNDWNTGEKVVAISTVGSALMFNVSMFLFVSNRNKCFEAIGAMAEEQNKSNDYGLKEDVRVELFVNPTIIGLSFRF